MNEFLTWETLGTFAGCAAVTGLLTQLLKEPLKKLPTQWLSYIIAVVLLFASTAATGGFAQPWTVWAMVLLNAVVVSLSSNGAFEAVKRVQGNKSE